ncbi:MAG: metallophosphoesterase [Clostridia bacterium]|nr:metallophosphoesterase [Clostridia bacterium]
MISWIIWGNRSIKTNELRVTSKDLPKAFDNFSIAHISDLHNAEHGKNNKKLIDILQTENPNIIVITGDLIDSNHTNIEIALSFVRQAVKIAPCYFVTGNHEAWVGSQYEKLRTELENEGVTILRDEAIELDYRDEHIQLIGLNDPDFSDRDSLLSESILETKLSQINISNGFTMLLLHRPEHFNVYQKNNIDLVLSGHAHGGQFRLPFLGGIIAPNQGFFPKYDAGIYTENETTMIVSRGIGNSIIPIRINNRPEIVIVKLNCGK